MHTQIIPGNPPAGNFPGTRESPGIYYAGCPPYQEERRQVNYAPTRPSTMRPADSQGIEKRSEERRQQTQALESSHQDLQKIVAALDLLREEEQRRLAHDMHDDLGQLLAAMKMDLATLRQRLPKNSPDLLNPVNNIAESVDTMMVSVRRIIADLPPKVLEDFGLFCAIERLACTFQTRYQINTCLQRPAQEPVLSCNLCTAIYRMVQEALTNIAKHARATEAQVDIGWQGPQLCILIRDNGTGLAPGCLRKPDSFGLVGMRQRVMALGGQFTVSSMPGSGTEVLILIPAAPECSAGS